MDRAQREYEAIERASQLLGEVTPDGEVWLLSVRPSRCPYYPNIQTPSYEQPEWIACRARELAEGIMRFTNVGHEPAPAEAEAGDAGVGEG